MSPELAITEPVIIGVMIFVATIIFITISKMVYNYLKDRYRNNSTQNDSGHKFTPKPSHKSQQSQEVVIYIDKYGLTDAFFEEMTNDNGEMENHTGMDLTKILSSQYQSALNDLSRQGITPSSPERLYSRANNSNLADNLIDIYNNVTQLMMFVPNANNGSLGSLDISHKNQADLGDLKKDLKEDLKNINFDDATWEEIKNNKDIWKKFKDKKTLYRSNNSNEIDNHESKQRNRSNTI